MHSDSLLVAAIMPTRGRQRWAAEAVEMFLEQTWRAKELVIVDDLDDRSFESVPDLPFVRYHVLEHRLTIGAKRNVAIEHSRGEIICHWDSDDAYTADRIEHQVGCLVGSGLDLTGYRDVEFVNAETGERHVNHSARPVGVSLCYWRRVWQERPFSNEQIGEERLFTAGRRMHVVPADGRIVARLHPGNTCDKSKAIAEHPHQWRRVA